MRIHVYHSWKMNFNSKKGRRKSFLRNQSINSFILMSRMNMWCPINKRIGIIMWIHVYPNWKTTFKTKNGTNWSFSYETKVLIHLSQWVEWICGAQSLKEQRLFYEFGFIPIEKGTLILKWHKEKFFLWNQSLNSFIQMSKMNLLCPIINRKEIIMWMAQREVSIMKPKHRFIYPNE